MSTRYFGGTPDHLGNVSSLSAQTFADLVADLRTPCQLAVTKADLMAMPRDKATKAKTTDYIVPATFRTDPSPRKTEHAQACNLLCVDVDDSAEALRMMETGWPTLLGNLGAIVYHTARSVPDAPRLRVIVHAEAIPVGRYASAVAALAAHLGIRTVSRESQVPVQPMFWPVCFQDDDSDPVIYANPTGEPFVLSAATNALNAEPLPEVDGDDMGNIEYLRSPVEGIAEEDVESALTKVNADCPMQQWVEIGMGLKHQFGEAGYELWDKWSAKSKDKYPGEDETRSRWDSFVGQTGNRAPVTIRSVLRIAEAAGWENKALGDNLYASTVDWMQSSSRSTEELLDNATLRIAKAAPLVGPLKQAALIGTLARIMKNRGIAGMTVTSLTAAVKTKIAEIAKAGGKSSPPPWSANIVFITASNLFYRFIDNRKMRPEVVDLIYRAPNPDKRAREYLIHDAGIRVVENLRYDPSTTDRFILHEGVPFCNTYRQTYVPADFSQIDEVAEFFVPHAEKLFGAAYATTMIDIGAYMVQKPGKKIRWVPLIQSGVGAGKGLWAAFYTAAMGVTNVQRLSADHVLEATYNSWATGYQLTVLDEVYNPGSSPQKHQVTNKLKPSISDDFISIRNLYEPVQTVPNIMNIVMFTNYHNALAIHDDDRRYFVIKSPLQNATDILALGGDAYFERGYNLLRTHAGGVRAFFESWGISKTFKPEGRAPVTPYLKEMATASASPLSAAVQEVLDDQPHPLTRADLVSINSLRAVMATDKLPSFTDQGLGAVLREKGFVYVGRHTIDGVRHGLWARGLTGDPAQEAATRLEIL